MIASAALERRASPHLDAWIRKATVIACAAATAACTSLVPVGSIVHDVSPLPHGFDSSFVNACRAMNWSTCDDPIFSDDQRFKVKGTSFGAHVYVAPSPRLPFYTDTSFGTPQLVGLVYLKTEPGTPTLPDTYTGMHLIYGTSCMYLRSSQQVFYGYIAPVPPDGKCLTSYTPNPDHRVAAFVQNSPGEPGSGRAKSAPIPPVARLHEGATADDSSVAPMIGLLCGSNWCVLQATGTLTVARAAHQDVNTADHTWNAFGWFDSQHLAIPKPVGAGVMPSNQNASIIAKKDLANNTWLLPTGAPGRAQHAATFYLKDGPVSEYDQLWHLRKGQNKLYVWRVDANTWRGEIRNRSGLTTYRIPVHVSQKHKGTNPPYTARFRWSADDDEIWVACEGGCCYVTAFRY